MLNKTCAGILSILLCTMMIMQTSVIAGTNLISSSAGNLKIWGSAYYNGYSYVFYQGSDYTYYKYSSDGGVTWSDAYSLGFSSDIAVNQKGNRIVITWWVNHTHMGLMNGTIGNGEITLSSVKYIEHPISVDALSRTAAFHPTDENIIYMAHGRSNRLSFTMVNISAGTETELMYALDAGYYYFTTILGNYCIIYWLQPDGFTIYVRTYNIQTNQWDETSVSSPFGLGRGSYYGSGSTFKINNIVYGVLVGYNPTKAVLVKFRLTDTGIISSCVGVVDENISTFMNFNFAQIGYSIIGVGGTSYNSIFRYDFDVETRRFVNRTQVAINAVNNLIRGYAVVLNNTNFGVIYTKYESEVYNLYVDVHQYPTDVDTYFISSSANNLKLWGAAYYNGYSYLFYQEDSTNELSYIYSNDGGVSWVGPFNIGTASGAAVNQKDDRIVITWEIDSTHMGLMNGTIGNGEITLSPSKSITHPRSVAKLSRTVAFHPTDKNIIYMAHASSGSLSFTKVDISDGTETELMYKYSRGYYHFITIFGDYCIIYWLQYDSSAIYVRTYNIHTSEWDETSLTPPVNLGGGSYYGSGSSFRIYDDVYGVLVGYNPTKAVLVKFSMISSGINATYAGVVDENVATFTNFNFAQLGSAAIGVGGTSDNEVYRYDFLTAIKTFVNRTQVAVNVVNNPIKGYAVVLGNTTFGVVYTKYQDTVYNLYVDVHQISIVEPSQTAFATITGRITTTGVLFATTTANISTNETYHPPAGGGGGIIELPYAIPANYIALVLILLIPTVVIRQQVGNFATIPTLTVMWIISYFAELISLGLFVIGMAILIAFIFRRRVQGEGEV